MVYKDIQNTAQDVDGINKLFTEVMQKHGGKNDAWLSFFLHVAPPVISKMRNGKLPMGPSMMLRLHEIGGLDIAHIRKMVSVEK